MSDESVLPNESPHCAECGRNILHLSGLYFLCSSFRILSCLILFCFGVGDHVCPAEMSEGVSCVSVELMRL